MTDHPKEVLRPASIGGLDTKSPIFVLGCGRSGTTLVRLMLASHPRIGIPPEGQFMLDLFRRFYHGGRVLTEPMEQFADSVLASDRFVEWRVDRKCLLQRLRAVPTKTYANLVDAVYVQYLSSLEGNKVRWGDKNIDYVMSIPKLLQLFPAAKIIHVVRDGRDVALSYRAVDFGPRDLFSTAVFWRRRTTAGRVFGERLGPHRYCEVKYETLVGNPVAECERICKFVSEDYSNEMLAFHENNRLQELVPKHRLAWHGRTLDPVTTARVGLWRQQMTEEEITLFEAVAGTAMRRFGYETHRFRRSAPFTARLARRWLEWVGRGLWRRIRGNPRARGPGRAAPRDRITTP